MPSLLEILPEFLYPISETFPTDIICKKIFYALDNRNWNVPNINIEYSDFGSGKNKYLKVWRIYNNTFSIRFGRKQGSLEGSYNNTAAVSEIKIPKNILDLYEDGSGPVLTIYTGKDWEKDKSVFMSHILVNAKINNKPKIYLKYKNFSSNPKPDFLEYEKNDMCEYAPEGDEPESIYLPDKYNRIIEWLKENVLDYILNFPEANESFPPIYKPVSLIPYTGKPLYAFCTNISNIEQYKENKYLVTADDFYAISPSRRLIRLGIVNKNNSFPKESYDGFIWCDTKQDLCEEVRELSFYPKNYIIEVKPKYANDIYVVDNAAYNDTRLKIIDKINNENKNKKRKLRDRFTSAEVEEMNINRAKTLIPYTEYKNDYKDPIFLIRREVEFDEIGQIIEENT